MRAARRHTVTRAGALALVWALGAPGAAEQLLTRTYTAEDGLASDRVVSIVVDRDGFLWVGTLNGLSRFDGASFVTYSTAEGLPYHTVNHLLHSRAGTRWVATNGRGIARFEGASTDEDGRVFTLFPVGETPRSRRVNRLLETRGGELLAGTDGGLYRAPSAEGEPEFEIVPLGIPGEPDVRVQIWSIAEDRGGDVWIGTSAGLVVLRQDGATEHWPVAPASGTDHVWSILPDDAGRLWLGHDAGLLIAVPPFPRSGRRPLLADAVPCARTAGGEVEIPLPTRAGQVCHWMPEMRAADDRIVVPQLRTADGTVWMIAAAGLVAFDGRRMREYGQPRGMRTHFGAALVADPGGDLWVAGEAGVTRVLRRGFVHYTTADGLAERAVSRVLEGPKGNLFAVSPSPYIHRLRGDRWTAVRPNVPIEPSPGGRSGYGAALLDRRGRWWVGTGDGLFVFPPVEELDELARIPPVAHYTVAEGLAGNDIYRLHEDARGDVWIAHRIPRAAPLTRWRHDTGELERFGPRRGLPARRVVLSMADDPAGGLWVSFWEGGLARFDGTRFRFHPPGRELPPGLTGAVHVDSRGRLWAVADGVLLRAPEAGVPDPELTRYPVAGGGSATRFTHLAHGAAGWVYLSSIRGLSRLHPATGAYHELGRGTPFTGTRHIHTDRRGRVWFSTLHGVMRYDPRAPRESRPSPVWIQGVSVAGNARPVPPMGAAQVSLARVRGGQRIEIAYSALGYGPSQPLRFQVRLDGVDEDWGPATTLRRVAYTALGSGSYRFRVRALNAAGRPSPQPASLSFAVPPPIWRHPAFVILLVAGVAALLTAAHRLRVRRLVELERVRTRIAADLHDDLGASLARVSLLSEAARGTLEESPQTAARLVGEIGETARELVGAAGDIAYAIDPGRGRLDGLVARLRRFAEEMLAGTEIAWSLAVHGETDGIELSSELRRHLLAILKEGLHNAVRHGRPRRIGVTFTVEDGSLEVELADDGRGFPTGVPLAGEEPPAGQGLRSMRRRAREAGVGFDIESRPGAGTRIALRVLLTDRMFMRWRVFRHP